jgi:hypothetical protein
MFITIRIVTVNQVVTIIVYSIFTELRTINDGTQFIEIELWMSFRVCTHFEEVENVKLLRSGFSRDHKADIPLGEELAWTKGINMRKAFRIYVITKVVKTKRHLFWGDFIFNIVVMTEEYSLAASFITKAVLIIAVHVFIAVIVHTVITYLILGHALWWLFITISITTTCSSCRGIAVADHVAITTVVIAVTFACRTIGFSILDIGSCTQIRGLLRDIIIMAAAQMPVHHSTHETYRDY